MTSSPLRTGEDAPPNSGAPDSDLAEARAWVLHIQTKLHQWATTDSDQRFDDLYNLVCNPATLAVAWDRIKRNRGSRTAGVDGETRWYIEHRRGVPAFLADTRATLRDRTFQPCAVRRHGIPKADGKVRYLGIPTIRDRVVQMALKLILEPIFEADFVATSYGFRPGRRTQDAIAEIYHFAKAPSNYEYVVEGDIEACFDRIDHASLMTRVRKRVGDRKVLALVKAFLTAGIMTELGTTARSDMGTPQGGIVSPLLANIALSALDEHFDRAWLDQSRYYGHRKLLHRRGLPTYRLIRYADDFVIMVKGTREQAEALKEELATVLAKELKLTLSPAKTLVTHIDEGFDFLGFRIQRKTRNGKRVVYTFPSRKAFESIKRRVKALTRHNTISLSLPQLLDHINPLLRGWTSYFRHAASKRTFGYLDHFTWWRVVRWLRKKHKRPSWKRMKRRELRNWKIGEAGVQLFRPHRVPVERYRYRGSRIPSLWESANP
ncbi:MAG TPA: group II intron reverse transcriptase/maturase [Tepidiformaceae bacterium]